MNIVAGLFVFMLLISGCDDSTSSTDNLIPRKIFNNSVHMIKIDYPYLYIAADSAGLWRVKIDDDLYQKENLILPDSVESINYVSPVGEDLIVSSSNSIYQSLDGGKNWVERVDGVDYILNLDVIERFESHPEKILFHQGSVLYWSHDNAQTWNKSELSSPITEHVNAIYPDPFNNGIAFLYGRSSLFFAALYCISDYGKELKHEVKLNDLLSYDLSGVTDIIFDMRNNNTLYMSLGQYNGLFKSKDSGYNWETIESDSLYFLDIAQDSYNPNQFYAAGPHTIYVSQDTMHSFEKIGSIDDQWGILQIALEETKHNLFIVTWSGVYVMPLK